jgi:predicted PolB exonuclease-like 3'-5' exonuclease
MMNPICVDIETVAIADADTYLEPVSAPVNYKDEAKIAAYIAEERARQIDRAALDLDLNRIIALGIKEPGQPTFVMTEQDSGEAVMLNTLWDTWNGWAKRHAPMLVTFGGINFDVPVLLRRSLYLGIKAPYIQNDRYKHPQQIDLASILSMNGSLKMRGLQFFLQRFGYPGGGQDVTGKDIGQLYAEGNWQAIADHCRADVDGTAWLAERIGAVPKQKAGSVYEAFLADGVKTV